MSNADKGFGSMDPAEIKAIASLGGKAAHAKGTAHKWTREEAQAAGIKGGRKTSFLKREGLIPHYGKSHPKEVEP